MQTARSLGLGAAWGCVFGALALGACSDAAPAGPPVAPPSPHLLVRTEPASTADCPHGGSVVLAGTDNDGDGVLQDAEVASRAVVCNPAPVVPPPPIVIRLVAEPPGAHCSAGGTAVESGPDQNGNGRLDDSEVTHIDYLCDQVLLTRLAVEPPGPRCLVGGVEFLSGRDRDGDGVLQDAEVEVSELQCGDVVTRDVTIGSAADLPALANIRVITGNVMVILSQGTLSLPHLEHVGGQLQIFGFQLTDIALPALQDVGGKLSINAGDAIEVPQLRRVGGLELRLMGVSDLGGFSALTEIDGDVSISEMSSLVSIDLSSLAIRGNLEIFFDDQLARITLKLADRVGFVAITDSPALQTLDLSVTAQTPGSAEIGDVDLFSNPALTHVALSADRVRSLATSGDPVISDIAFEVAKFDSHVSLSHIATPFGLTLSSPSPDGVEFGGGLFISGPLQTFDASAPVTVDGLCVFDKTLLQALDLRTPLRVKEGVRFSDNSQLTRISPITLTGSLQVINNARLDRISFVSPASAGEIGSIVITDNPVLTSAPSLASLGSVRGFVDVERNPALTGLFGPSLTLIDGPMSIISNASLADLQLPGLRHVVSDLFVQFNAALQTLELPALTEVANELFITSNPQLHHIAFDALTRSDFFGVDNNPRLPACEVLAVFAHVTSLSASQSGNDNTATCP